MRSTRMFVGWSTRAPYGQVWYSNRNGSLERADEDLELYRDDNETGDMAYRKWVAIHKELPSYLAKIVDEGNDLSRKAGATPRKIEYVWADAIANALYAHYHE